MLIDILNNLFNEKQLVLLLESYYLNTDLLNIIDINITNLSARILGCSVDEFVKANLLTNILKFIDVNNELCLDYGEIISFKTESDGFSYLISFYADENEITNEIFDNIKGHNSNIRKIFNMYIREYYRSFAKLADKFNQ